MDILVIGGSGLVGQNIVAHCQRRNHDVTATYRSMPTEAAAIELDKTDFEQTREMIVDSGPDFVVDTAAFHAVDDCETERVRAADVNVTGTQHVAAAAAEIGAHFVYLSTDYVFPGDPAEAPYSETDPVAPCNYYARTKLAAEQVAQIPQKWTVLRPSVMYGLARPNFVTWALDELRMGNQISVVNDQTSTPTYAPDLARACIETGELGLTGLYHATGPSRVSRYQFTLHVADAYGLDRELINPISSEELGQKAPRPTDSSLDSMMLYKQLGWEFSPPRDSLREMK